MYYPLTLSYVHCLSQNKANIQKKLKQHLLSLIFLIVAENFDIKSYRDDMDLAIHMQFQLTFESQFPDPYLRSIIRITFHFAGQTALFCNNCLLLLLQFIRILVYTDLFLKNSLKIINIFKKIYGYYFKKLVIQTSVLKSMLCYMQILHVYKE